VAANDAAEDGMAALSEALRPKPKAETVRRRAQVARTSVVVNLEF
jgi:hypothetical protein